MHKCNASMNSRLEIYLQDFDKELSGFINKIKR
jgi:hypothetical protein